MTLVGLRQILAALAGAGLTAAACYALGAIFLDWITSKSGAPFRRYERFPLALVLGAACLHLIVFAILVLHAGYWPVLLAVLLASIGVAIRNGSWKLQGLDAQPLDRPLKVLMGLTGGAFFVVYFLVALAPEHSPDGATYHLGFVARYLRDHALEPTPNNFYGMLSQGMEMLFVPAFAIGRHPAAALLQLIFSVALGLALLSFGRRLGKPWAGAAAALLFFMSPVVGMTSSIAYVDVGTAAVVFAVFYFLELWREHRHSAFLIPAGLLAGYAYASKYTAAAIALYAVGFVFWSVRDWKMPPLRPILLIAGCASLMAGPWIVRNAVWYENPVAPFANRIFPNPYVHVSFEEGYAEYLSHYNVENKWELPLEVTLRGGATQGLIGPVFLLLPVVLIGLRSAALGGYIGRALLAAIPVFLPYFANVGTRFLIPCLPFLALAIALTLARSRLALAILIVVHAATSWPAALPAYADQYVWRIDTVPYRAALRITPQDEFLDAVIPGFEPARMLDGYVPEGESVLTFSGVPDSYTRRNLRLSFQSAENEMLSDLFNLGWIVGNQPISNHTFQFPERPVQRFRVVQTAVSEWPQQWNMHELHVLHGGVELQRAPDWRLKASVNPWDIQLAFDGSPASRWRSWQTPMPGDYIEVDLGTEQPIDQVTIATSHESPSVQIRLDVQIPSGEWQTVADAPEMTTVPPLASIRRDAMFAIHNRGVDYILIFNEDFGAIDILDDPEAWGLTEVATVKNAHLFKTIWADDPK